MPEIGYLGIIIRIRLRDLAFIRIHAKHNGVAND